MSSNVKYVVAHLLYSLGAVSALQRTDDLLL